MYKGGPLYRICPIIDFDWFGCEFELDRGLLCFDGSGYGPIYHCRPLAVVELQAGAAAAHFWNRNPTPTYSYRPDYNAPIKPVPIPQLYSSPLSQTQQLSQVVTPPKNTQQLIPNHQVQPLFTPAKIAPNLATPSKPIVNEPTVKFAPIQVVKSVATPSVTKFAPAQVVKPQTSTPKFKPTQVRK